MAAPFFGIGSTVRLNWPWVKSLFYEKEKKLTFTLYKYANNLKLYFNNPVNYISLNFFNPRLHEQSKSLSLFAFFIVA